MLSKQQMHVDSTIIFNHDIVIVKAPPLTLPNDLSLQLSDSLAVELRATREWSFT